MKPVAEKPKGIDIASYKRRFSDMKQEADSWRRHWREIQEWLAPRRGWYLSDDNEDVNEGKLHGDRIINSTVAWCARTLAGGMHTGLTSSSRPWFRILPENEDLKENTAVSEYLFQLQDIVERVLSSGNFYPEIYDLYYDAGIFGTAAMLMEDDLRNVIRFRLLPVGSFYSGVDANGTVDTIFRRFSLSADQILREFGERNASSAVRQAARDHSDRRFVILQCIQPVEASGIASPEWSAFESVYFEETTKDNIALKVGHYRTKPFVVIRWNAQGNCPYGSRSPGMDSLGDCKQLQLLERKKLLALDNAIDPPLAVPDKLKGRLKRRPGQVTWIQSGSPSEEIIRPLYNVAYDIDRITREIQTVEKRIERSFYNDLFLSVIFDRKQMTATEIAQRQEEKTIVLGPMIERFQAELLGPIIKRTVDAVLTQNLLPKPPQELAGQFTRYEYSGPLAMNQQLLSLSNVERWIAMGAEMARFKPDVLDKFDHDQAVDVAASILGVEPSLVVPDDKVAELRQARMQSQQQTAQTGQQMMALDAAQTMSEIDLDGNNALSRALKGFGS